MTGNQDTNAHHGAGVAREKCVVCTQPKGMCSGPLIVLDRSRGNAKKHGGRTSPVTTAQVGRAEPPASARREYHGQDNLVPRTGALLGKMSLTIEAQCTLTRMKWKDTKLSVTRACNVYTWPSQRRAWALVTRRPLCVVRVVVERYHQRWRLEPDTRTMVNTQVPVEDDRPDTHKVIVIEANGATHSKRN